MPRNALFLIFPVMLLFFGCRSSFTSPQRVSWEQFQKKASTFNSVLLTPDFENDAGALGLATDKTIKSGNQILDQIAQLQPAEVTFQNTCVVLDDLAYQSSLMENRLYLIKETSINPALRETATALLKKLDEWSVGLDYREDVYASLKVLEHKMPLLTVENQRLLAETLKDYRRAGMELSKSERAEVEKHRKELAEKCTDFSAHVNKARRPVQFTRSQLAGLSEDFLASVKTGSDQYTIQPHITLQYIMVLENARSENTRKAVLTAQHQLAMAENVPLMNRIIELRQTIARKLGYDSWADYQIEPKMAKNTATVLRFLDQLNFGLQPKLDAEIAQLASLKQRETGNPQAKIELWDWRYYANQLKKEKFTIDTEQLRAFFPYDRVLEGMFRIYRQIFSIRIEPVEAPYKWVDDLQLFVVSDADSGEPLGAFYLDMFPREGKYNHFAEFPLIPGKRLPDGRYQRPVAALICNFPPPSTDRPSLLSHEEVETLFHEFGHALHVMLSQANYNRFSGTSVPGDFVEAPSQMLENWVWDKTVLDSFAADYRDPSRKIPAEILSQLKKAKLATIGMHYKRQLSFGYLDLALHGPLPPGEPIDCVKLSNPVLSKVFLPVPPDTAFVAFFGHLAGGYDGGYYGYAWADAIAADMATVFEKAPRGYFDSVAGRRLRDEIYAPGDSRPVEESIEKFLGRPRSLEPFLKTLGISGNSSPDDPSKN